VPDSAQQQPGSSRSSPEEVVRSCSLDGATLPPETRLGDSGRLARRAWACCSPAPSKPARLAAGAAARMLAQEGPNIPCSGQQQPSRRAARAQQQRRRAAVERGCPRERKPLGSSQGRARRPEGRASERATHSPRARAARRAARTERAARRVHRRAALRARRACAPARVARSLGHSKLLRSFSFPRSLAPTGRVKQACGGRRERGGQGSTKSEGNTPTKPPAVELRRRRARSRLQRRLARSTARGARA